MRAMRKRKRDTRKKNKKIEQEGLVKTEKGKISKQKR